MARMGSAFAKPTARQALWDSCDLWDRASPDLSLLTFTSGAYAIHVHLNGGDAFSAGDFLAGVAVESQEAENR
jgi:hypothetical protein